MNIIYQPFFRDSSSDESSISFLDFISGYRPNKTKKEEDTTVKEDTTKETDVKEATPVVTNETPNQSSTTKKFSNKREFIATMLPIYEKVLSQKGLPKDFARMIVAQDGLESAWGSKPSGKFNYGGIKGKGTTLDTKEFVNGKEVKVKDNFRDFKSLEDYATYKVNLLNNKRYNAFSKPISEFADSVFKGGYATDPKYAEKLNKVIASVKNGGVMRFQDGGSLAEGKEWLKNWYHGRIPQLESNWFSNWSGALWDFSIPRYRDLVGNMNRVRAEINPKYVPKGADGVYYTWGHRIFLNEDNPSVAIHEYTHGSRPRGQIKQIEKIQDLFGDHIYDSSAVSKDDYLDDPNEIYARLMELRHALNFDPNHKFTKEEIDQLKKAHTLRQTVVQRVKDKDGNSSFRTITADGDCEIIEFDPPTPEYKDVPGETHVFRIFDKDNTFDILDRYSTNALEMLFNDVAKNTTSNKDEKKNDAVYGQLGLKIPVVLRNGYNDPEHYYDYSRGAYDPKTGHWYDRDPESGIELKNPNHPTAFLHHEIEEQLGNKRYQDNTGRYYTFSEEETPKYRYNYGPLTPILGLKEIDYPSYGEDRVDMKESIANNPRVRYI